MITKVLKERHSHICKQIFYIVQCSDPLLFMDRDQINYSIILI